MVLIQLTLERFEEEARVRCGTCGREEPFARGAVLPASGGALEVQDGRVVTRTCGPCWEARPLDGWTCVGCQRANPQWMNWCLGCHAPRRDPRPYVPDRDLIEKEIEERRRDHELVVAEADRLYPGWRSAGLRRLERI